MLAIFYFFVFLFGLVVGSFLNCVIYRMEVGKSFTKGRSFCPKCKHTLGFWDLIPLASFVALRGRCQYCKEKISLQYPIVEVAMGVLAILISYFLFLNHFLFSISYWINFLYLFTVFAFLLVIFVYDLKHYLIPDKVIFPAITFVFLFRLFEVLNLNHWNLFGIWNLEFGILNPLLSVLLASGFFFLIWLISRGKWMGFGDVKLAFFMGLFLGWPKILPALFFSFAFGAIIGAILMALKKKGLKSEVPFGPFLITGTMVGLFWGENIMRWYMQFLG